MLPTHILLIQVWVTAILSKRKLCEESLEFGGALCMAGWLTRLHQHGTAHAKIPAQVSSAARDELACAKLAAVEAKSGLGATATTDGSCVYSMRH